MADGYADTIWEILEMFDAMPEIDEKTKQKISERMEAIIDDLCNEAWENGHYPGEDLY
jgi:hypothetical protein